MPYSCRGPHAPTANRSESDFISMQGGGRVETCGFHLQVPARLLGEQGHASENTLPHVALWLGHSEVCRAISSLCVVTTHDCGSKQEEEESRRGK